LHSLKAKFHYASWFEAGSKLVADLLATKFPYEKSKTQDGTDK